MTPASLVERDGYALATYVSGQPKGSATIILSNSIGSDHRMWRHQLQVLETHYRVVRYDTRGHGRSRGGTDAISLDDLVADVVAILDHHEIASSDFLGLSMGGMTGL